MSVIREGSDERPISNRNFFLDVITNSAPDETWMWMVSGVGFSNNSRLIVNDGEEAIFTCKGKIQYIFNEPGTYVLNIENYPFLSRVRNIVSGGIRLFYCKIYFAMNTILSEIKWGIGHIPIRNDYFVDQVEVFAHGSYHLRINSTEKALKSIITSGLSRLNADGFPLKNLVLNAIRVEVEKIILDSYRDELIQLRNDTVIISNAIQKRLSKK